MIPPQYQPRLLTESEKEGYFNWSLDFFTDRAIAQVPCVDLTIQLDVTKAYQLYQSQSQTKATFFSFLIWHLLQTLKTHLSFNLRQVEDQWYILDNPPVMIPVAVGGKERFWEMVLVDSYNQSYSEFINRPLAKVSDDRQFCLQRKLIIVNTCN